MAVKLLHDRVLLKPIEEDEKSSGGIVLASASKEPKYEAKVLEVGKGRTTEDGLVIPLDVVVGDIVMYNPAPAVKVKVNGEDLLVIKESEIYAVVESNTK